MEKINDGGPVFPTEIHSHYKTGPVTPIPVSIKHPGMSLRDYYIGQAIEGFCSREFPSDMKSPFVEWASDMAIELADEIIKKIQLDGKG